MRITCHFEIKQVKLCVYKVVSSHCKSPNRKSMKIFKGCIITLVIFVAIGTILFLVYKNSAVKNLSSINSQVENQWEKTAKLIKQKNSALEINSTISDSLRFYIKQSRENNQMKICDSVDINTEYAINKLSLKDSVMQINIDELNQNLVNYNSLVRNYNTQRSTFPAFLIYRKVGFVKYYRYLDMVYGIENESPQQKTRKTREWQRKIEDSILK